MISMIKPDETIQQFLDRLPDVMITSISIRSGFVKEISFNKKSKHAKYRYTHTNGLTSAFADRTKFFNTLNFFLEPEHIQSVRLIVEYLEQNAEQKQTLEEQFVMSEQERLYEKGLLQPEEL
jgi:hypothetical protein